MPRRLDELTLERVILDTNTWVSGTLFADSLPGRAIAKARREAVVLASNATLAELAAVLKRGKFDRYSSLSKRLTALRDIASASRLIEVDTEVDVCRDPKDNQFLSLALAGKAHLLITGDLDLLTLRSFGTTRIVTAKEYLDED